MWYKPKMMIFCETSLKFHYSIWYHMSQGSRCISKFSISWCRVATRRDSGAGTVTLTATRTLRRASGLWGQLPGSCAGNPDPSGIYPQYPGIILYIWYNSIYSDGWLGWDSEQFCVPWLPWHNALYTECILLCHGSEATYFFPDSYKGFS